MGLSATGLWAGRAILGWLSWWVASCWGMWVLRSVHLGGGPEPVVLMEES